MSEHETCHHRAEAAAGMGRGLASRPPMRAEGFGMGSQRQRHPMKARVGHARAWTARTVVTSSRCGGGRVVRRRAPGRVRVDRHVERDRVVEEHKLRQPSVRVSGSGSFSAGSTAGSVKSTRWPSVRLAKLAHGVQRNVEQSDAEVEQQATAPPPLPPHRRVQDLKQVLRAQHRRAAADE
eukprot:4055943-Prymnesium_polylepis.1